MARKLLTEEEIIERETKRREYFRLYRRKKRAERKAMEKRRERQRSSKVRERKKDFSDAEFSKWWHNKIERVRQALNY